MCKNKSLDFDENRTQVKSFTDKYHNHYTKQPCDVTPQKIFLYLPEKYPYRVRILFFVKGKKRMRIYACSVNGNLKQTNESKNFIRKCVFLQAYPYFFAHMRKYGRSVKAALLVNVVCNLSSYNKFQVFFLMSCSPNLQPTYRYC